MRSQRESTPMQMNPLQKQGVGDFRYFVGISSLAQIATREDRVLSLIHI